MRIARVEVFQLRWNPADRPQAGSAFLRVWSDDGRYGLGEASPMEGGLAALRVLATDVAPAVIGADPLDHALIGDRLLHRLVKLGPEGVLTAALAALDIALWDLKGKLLGLPVYKLLGGAARTALPFYASIGHNGARSVDEVCRVAEVRLRDAPAAIKIRFDSDRSQVDRDIPGDIAKARALRALVGPDYPLAFDANNGYSTSGAMRVGRALEELNYWWFEEPLQHYYVRQMGELGRRLDITVAAGEQCYTLSALAEMIEAGVTMVQPDIIKMGGITGLQRCAALALAHGVELVPHQTQPVVGHLANLHVAATQWHATKPCELNDPTARTHAVFVDPPVPREGLFHLSGEPGLGITLLEAQLGKHWVEVS